MVAVANAGALGCYREAAAPGSQSEEHGGLGLMGVRGQHAEATHAQLPCLPLYSLVMLCAVLAATYSTPSYTKKGAI